MIPGTQYDVFLSHNGDDKAAVEIIAHRLREEAKLRPFLDKWHLIPGKSWQEAIEEALEQSETVAVFVGPSGISPWHNEEMRAALDTAVRTHDEYRVIPVLLPGASEDALTGFLARRIWVDFRSGLDDADAFDRLVAGVLGQPPEEAGAFALPDEPVPYPGLLPFTARQANFFFGRTEERDRLLTWVRRSPFVAVVGASGSGKSSLVLAGLLPALDKNWHALTLMPGARPLRALADQLAMLVPSKSCLHLADDLEARLADRADGLCTAVSTLWAGRPEATTLLIVVDQFEELFTQVAGTPKEVRQEQRQFIANLVEAVRTFRGRVRVVLTLRADFFRHCLDFPNLRIWLETNQFLLGPLGEDALREAVVKPAQVVGAMFEKGLVSRLIDDMRDQPAALPLMGFALAQLWQQRHGVWLTHAAYETIGGVSGAIDQRADAVYDQLSGTQKLLARNLFVRLVALGKGTSDTRRRIRRDELNLVGATLEEVEELTVILSHRDVRLIAADADTVELAHDALIERWGQLRDWLDEDRAGLRTHRRLTEAAEEWDRSGRDESYLYHGTRLAEAKEWAKAHADDLNRQERQFLKASRRAMWMSRTVTIMTAVVAIAVLAAVTTLAATGQLNQLIYRPLSMEWVEIPAGEFLMGSSDTEISAVYEVCPSCDVSNEQPQHSVYLRTYQIGQYEVTNKQYRQCIRAGVCNTPNHIQYDVPEFDNYPVTGVDWEDARTFCEWIGGRLPYEAEWEKAARGPAHNAGKTRVYPWGNEKDSQKANVAPDAADKAMPVGSYSPGGDSPYGISDMSGNVWEWVMDWYDEDYYDNSPPHNPIGAKPRLYRVLRGGSFEDSWIDARSTYRAYNYPGSVSEDIGFRCVR